MNIKKILGLFAVALSTAGVSSAFAADCHQVAYTYNRTTTMTGYKCSGVYSYTGAFRYYSCSNASGSLKWYLAPKGDYCVAVQGLSTTTTSSYISGLGWIPTRLAPSIKYY
jgi:hypothetical protein